MDNNVSLKDLYIALKDNFFSIVSITSFFAISALIYLLFFYPPIFSSSATVVHFGNDMKQSQSSGLMSSLGISLPTSSSSTPSAEVIIQILKSNSFSRSLMEKEFFFTPLDKKVPLYQIILDDFKTENNNVNIYKAKKAFQEEMMIVDKNRMTNVINISIHTVDAQLSYDIIIDAISLLNQIFNSIEKEKALEKSIFVQERLLAERKQLLQVENKYIEFRNNNQSIQSPLLKIKEDSIKRELEMHSQVVSMLMQQLEMTQLDLYDEINEVLIVSEPEVMPFRTNRRIFLLIGSIFAGFFISLTYVLSILLLKPLKKF